MATKSEVQKEVKLALEEVGQITPHYDKRFKSWLFHHPLYPVECEGQSKEEVIQKYPEYLAVFIEQRLKGNLDEVNERKTKGRGGARKGAGRPVGSTKEPTTQIRVPLDIASWLKRPGMIEHLRFILKPVQPENRLHR